MLIKNLTLGLGIVLAGSALAQDQTYKVKNGDCDWTIARKFNTTIPKLHEANPSIRNWDALQNGHLLHIPGSIAKLAVAKKISVGAPHLAAHLAGPTTRPFTVSNDDNDWIIAHHLGISLHTLHAVNPGVDWNKLRPGKKILIPVDGSAPASARVASKSSSSSKASKIKVNKIHSRYAVVNTDGVSIRREAGSHAERITTVGTGTRVVVLDRDGAWYHLRFPHGTEGWVRGDYLNAAHAPVASRHHHSSSSERVASHTRSRHHYGNHPEAAFSLDSDTQENPIIKRAVAMRGTRYSYGSSSRSATDCSGYTWQVYGKQGIHLPRTSQEQSHVGKSVSRDSLKPGDLVFFSTRGSRGVGHVGIAIGHDKFIHASSGGGRVMVSSLNEGYYANHYKGARRPAEISSKKKKASRHESSHSSAPAKSSGGEDTDPTPLGK